MTQGQGEVKWGQIKNFALQLDSSIMSHEN